MQFLWVQRGFSGRATHTQTQTQTPSNSIKILKGKQTDPSNQKIFGSSLSTRQSLKLVSFCFLFFFLGVVWVSNGKGCPILNPKPCLSTSCFKYHMYLCSFLLWLKVSFVFKQHFLFLFKNSNAFGLWFPFFNFVTNLISNFFYVYLLFTQILVKIRLTLYVFYFLLVHFYMCW